MRSAEELVLRPLPEAPFARAWDELRACVAEGVAPGAVLGVWDARWPDQGWGAAVGRRREVPNPGLAMSLDTIFDLASVSKVYATATLAAWLVDRGWISWSTRLSSVFAGYPFEDIEVRHLLSHTAGFAAWEPYYERLRERLSPGKHSELWRVSISERQQAMREMIFAVKPEVAPEERAVYSDISFLLLGFLLEEVTQMPLDRAVRDLLWKPLGAARSEYRRVNRSVEAARDEGVAATEDCPWRGGVLQGQVHDDNTWAMGGYAGHAGVFGDARDLLHFARRMLGGFLSRATLEAAWTRVPRPVGCERTLGWDTPSGESPAASTLFLPGSVGHLGFTGTSLWIDPRAGVAVTLLTNRVHPSRENIKIREYRARLHRVLRQDLAAWGRL
jgi:CubicO group peptidase (beta-lactamase class C family)